jgi:hypothetical protein
VGGWAAAWSQSGDIDEKCGREVGQANELRAKRGLLLCQIQYACI